MQTTDINDEWMQFLNGEAPIDGPEYTIPDNDATTSYRFNYANLTRKVPNDSVAPTATDIYISTKTIITFLKTNNQRAHIDLDTFWSIPIVPYSLPTEGVVKKQIKINTKTPEELNQVLSKLPTTGFIEQNIISHIDNPTGRIKFKDVRKISIGISKKDILKCRQKQKKAFYNCIVLILRIKMDTFREFHVKVFNTGKVEIPGMKSDDMFETVVHFLIRTLQPLLSEPLTWSGTKETVLTNSNFNCNFFVNREIMADILKNKYNLYTIYDPCSYPGVQCKFYYDQSASPSEQTGQHLNSTNVIVVPFMIFRTGSVLIVGKCSEQILHSIYQFVKQMLMDEYPFIYNPGRYIPFQMDNDDTFTVTNVTRRKKMLYILPKVSN